MPEFESHQLIKQIPGVFVDTINFSSNTSNISPSLPTEGWEILHEGTTSMVWVWRGYIDLAGWSKQELTNFIQTVDVQQSAPALTSPGLLNWYETNLVTSRRIPNDALRPPQLSQPGFINMFPPGIDDPMDLMQVIYGEWVNKTVSTAETATMVTVAADSFGSGSPIATDKLHITKVIYLIGLGTNEGFTKYPSNFVINAITTKEKDLVWMERLRRSYVLQEAV